LRSVRFIYICWIARVRRRHRPNSLRVTTPFRCFSNPRACRFSFGQRCQGPVAIFAFFIFLTPVRHLGSASFFLIAFMSCICQGASLLCVRKIADGNVTFSFAGIKASVFCAAADSPPSFDCPAANFRGVTPCLVEIA